MSDGAGASENASSTGASGDTNPTSGTGAAQSTSSAYEIDITFTQTISLQLVDENGYGLRVPAMVISPYARRGFIDHQTLSHDAYLKFIEDDFLGGARIDPKTNGRPDQRPTVRENVAILGDLRKDFDFNQAPRPPEILQGGIIWNGAPAPR